MNYIFTLEDLAKLAALLKMYKDVKVKELEDLIDESPAAARTQDQIIKEVSIVLDLVKFELDDQLTH